MEAIRTLDVVIKVMNFFRKQKFFFLGSLFLFLPLQFAQATTIGTNISVSGTLTLPTITTCNDGSHALVTDSGGVVSCGLLSGGGGSGGNSYASTTIGNGTGTGGLTVSGDATTTGDSYFAQNVRIGTNIPYALDPITTPGYYPTLTVYGGLVASSSEGESDFINTYKPSGQVDTEGSRGNVLSIQATQPIMNSAIRFLDENNNETMAIGHINAGGGYGGNKNFIDFTFDLPNRNEGGGGTPTDVVPGGIHRASALSGDGTLWSYFIIWLGDNGDTLFHTNDSGGSPMMTLTSPKTDYSELSVTGTQHNANAYGQVSAASLAGNKIWMSSYDSSFTTVGGDFVQSGSTLTTNSPAGLTIGSIDPAGIIQFFTGGYATGNERMRIDSAGNVGIGTTSPSQALSVAGNLYVSGNITCSGTCASGGGSSQWTTSGSDIYYDSGKVSVGTATPAANTALTVDGTLVAGNGLRSHSDSNDVAYFENSGNYTQFHMYNSAGGTDGYVSMNNTGSPDFGGGSNDTSAGMQMWTTTNRRVTLGTDSQDRLTVLGTGNVGIGTINPPAAFSVSNGTVDDTNGIAQFENPSLSGNNSYNFIDIGEAASNNNSAMFGYEVEPSPVAYMGVWGSGIGTQTLNINQSGAVGIGTAHPAAALDIDATSTIIEQSSTPSSSSAPCTTGTISWDASFTYVCVSTNTWKRSALSTW